MISVEEYKEALGFDTEGLPEDEILKLRQIHDDLAEIFFPMWKEAKLKSIEKQCQKIIKEETVLSTVE